MRLKVLLAVLAIVAPLPVATTLGAQTSTARVWSETNQDYSPSTGSYSDLQRCDESVSVGSVRVDCGIGNISADGLASNEGGVLKAGAHVGYEVRRRGVQTHVSSYATWVNTLMLDPAADVSSVVFGYAIWGDLAADMYYSPEEYEYLHASVRFNFRTFGQAVIGEAPDEGTRTTNPGIYDVHSYQYRVNVGSHYGRETVARKAAFNGLFMSYVVEGWEGSSFKFQSSLSTAATAVVGYQPTYAVTGYATSDFRNSAGLTELRLLNSAGEDVTDQVSYSFASAQDFYSAPGAVVPEPAMLFLLGTGLVGLGFATVRRRREDVLASQSDY